MSHWSLWSASSVGGWLGGFMSECITYVRENVKRISSWRLPVGHLPVGRRRGVVAGPVGAGGVARKS